MVTYTTIHPDNVPATWETYLEWVLDIEMKLREDRKPSVQYSQGTQAKASKDPNSMDIDTIKKPEKLSKEQEEWLAKSLCFRCGKHRVKRGEKCRFPKYKGFYEIPAASLGSKATTTVHKVEETESSNGAKEREEFIKACLTKFDEDRAKEKGKAKEEQVTAKIEEIEEEDFLQGVL